LVLNSLKEIQNKSKLKIKLIMTGQKYSNSRNILNYIKKNKDLNIRYLGKVSFKKLIKLYSNCKFLISPAIYESSSLTILEAIKMSKPIIASNTKPNKELGKIFKINFFKTNESNSLANLIIKIWKNKKLISKQIKFNRKYINLYNWKRISEKYKNEFYKMLN